MSDEVNNFDNLINRQLGDFLLKEKLGEGGFGTVYRAEQITLGREAVIKILHTRHMDDSEKIERFKREARLASRLEHPYTAHIYAFGAESDGLLWIAMELIRGTPLDRLLKVQGSLPLERFVPLLEKICEVIHTAHEYGIIHRDIKPANVMVISRAGQLLPKLLDFGIAKGLDLPVKKISFNKTAEDNLIASSETPTEIISPDNLVKENKFNLSNLKLDKDVLTLPNIPSQTANVNSLTVTNDKKISLEDITKSLKLTLDNLEGSPEALTAGIIGSPPYMAPEQWFNLSISAQTDIYALGVLSYEILTGKRPFSGNTHLEISLAHINDAVPSLGNNLPSSLDQVIAKAMAKNPFERYNTALEFASDFRYASGIKERQANLPQIDKAIIESFLANSPQPIAQAIANLTAVHNLHQVREELITLFQVLVNYLSMLTLACRQQVNLDNYQETELAISLLQKLYKEELSNQEWLELSKELCRPFINQKDAFPIPEIISLFFNSDNLDQTSLFEPFLLTQDLFKRGLIDSPEGLNILSIKMAQMSALLSNLSFLLDYHLVVAKENHKEKWMGLHFKTSEPLIFQEENSNFDQVLISNNNNLAIVKLSPLVKLASPFSGAKTEFFFFVGRGRSAARFVALPSGFELQDDDIWQWLGKNFSAFNENKKDLLALDTTPYLGLQSFTSQDASLFFGRERETEAFLNRIYAQTLLAVVGPSGAGKSSFIQAGIIPSLSIEWLSLTVRPGAVPLNTLITQLNKLGLKEIPTIEEIKNNSGSLGEFLRKQMLEQEKKLLIVVDQLEELFTLCLESNERQLFAQVLAEISRSSEEPTRVVLTLRDDFLMRAEELIGLKTRLSNGLYLLAIPNKDDLLRILVKPAKLSGFEFEDQKLPEEIVTAVAQESAALPLLAFTAAKLWQLRDRQFKQLRRKAYESMGGVGGALARHAENMLSQMATEQQGLVRELMKRLVTSENTRAVISRLELIQAIGKQTSIETVIEKLISSRLLTAYEGDDGIERIEIIHETLLTTWPRLVKWQQEDKEGSRLRDQLQIASKQWLARGKAKGLLWRDDVLVEYELWQSRYKIKLTEDEKAFAQASLAEASRVKKNNRLLVSTAILVLLVGSIILFLQRLNIEKQLFNFYLEQGRAELLKDDANKALLYLSEAYKRDNKNLSLRFMLTQALNKLEEKKPLILEGHNHWVRAIAFSPDSKKIASASYDKNIIIWEINSGKILTKLIGHNSGVNFVAFSPDGENLLTGSSDKTIKIWQVNNGQLLDNINFNFTINSLAFSPDGKFFAVVGYETSAKIFDFNTKKLVLSLGQHKNAISTINYNFDGSKLITASLDGTAKIYSANDGKLLATLDANNSLTSASFSPNDKYILTTSNDGSLKVWDAISNKMINSLAADKEQLFFADFNPDSEMIFTVGQDQLTKAWNINSDRQIYSFKGHTSLVRMLKISPDGKYLATASYDKSVTLCSIAIDTRSPEEVAKVVKEKVPFNLINERVEEKITTNSTAPTKLPQINFTNFNPINLQTFSFETIITDSKANITSRVNTQNEFYRENINEKIFFDMVAIPAGTFLMGSPKGEGSIEEFPQHQVKLDKFFIAQTEITQALWQSIMGDNPAYFKGDNLPVETINWYEAMLFCERLSQITGKIYRLPSEAEWEYAARATTTTTFAFGENITTDMANYDGSEPFAAAPKGLYRAKTSSVASFLPNKFGLYDMHGNVYEWCLDSGHDNYNDAPNDGSVQEKPYSGSRVLRGGAWYYPATDARSAARASVNPTSKLKNVGFRVVYQP